MTLQEKQEAYLQREEESLMRQEARSYDGFGGTRTYDLTCRTCDTSQVMHSPANIIGSWLFQHRDHRTWIVRTL